MLNDTLKSEIFSERCFDERITKKRLLFFLRYVETSALDATNVEQAFRTLIADIYRHWAARMDSMKDERPTPSPGSQVIRPGDSTVATNSTTSANSCCGSFT